MKDAILITGSTFKLSDLLVYAKNAIKFEEVNEAEIECNIPYQVGTYFSISKNNSTIDLMEPGEIEYLQSEFGVFNFFHCLFYDFHYLQVLLASIPPDIKVIIDNDHGRLLKKEEVLKFNSYEEFAMWP
ncbi:hypothetical protein [Chitinophaga varians]|uniref:hypothetical protein n=1 Tax=Chitinophaga varians TaxID=2202339 RepID=UPI00165F4DFD|nr:hypothetical protein [Chitinophaga varians]MBC9914073.1 hypothetical protein [Chitinophaga varians]